MLQEWWVEQPGQEQKRARVRQTGPGLLVGLRTLHAAPTLEAPRAAASTHLPSAAAVLISAATLLASPAAASAARAAETSAGEQM